VVRLLLGGGPPGRGGGSIFTPKGGLSILGGCSIEALKGSIKNYNLRQKGIVNRTGHQRGKETLSFLFISGEGLVHPLEKKGESPRVPCSQKGKKGSFPPKDPAPDPEKRKKRGKGPICTITRKKREGRVSLLYAGKRYPGGKRSLRALLGETASLGGRGKGKKILCVAGKEASLIIKK